MSEDQLPRGTVPPGTYAKGGRSPIVCVLLCAPCAGYAPITNPDYRGALSGCCFGCGAWARELHKFQALILSAANGGCFCKGHRQVTGDLPTEESVRQVWTEVKTRPARHVAAEAPRDATAPDPDPPGPGAAGSMRWNIEQGQLRADEAGDGDDH